MTVEEYKAILDSITDEDRKLLFEQDNIYATEKHGHWSRPQTKDTIIYARYMCSVCGSFNMYKFPYCSWCGAKMDEEMK